MSRLAEIETALPMRSAEKLARIEVTVHRRQREREVPIDSGGADARFDGRPWPKTGEEITARLAELDALSTLLTAQDADRFEAWRVEEEERQKSLSGGSGIQPEFNLSPRTWLDRTNVCASLMA